MMILVLVMVLVLWKLERELHLSLYYITKEISLQEIEGCGLQRRRNIVQVLSSHEKRIYLYAQTSNAKPLTWKKERIGESKKKQ